MTRAPRSDLTCLCNCNTHAHTHTRIHTHARAHMRAPTDNRGGELRPHRPRSGRRAGAAIGGRHRRAAQHRGRPHPRRPHRRRVRCGVSVCARHRRRVPAGGARRRRSDGFVGRDHCTERPHAVHHVLAGRCDARGVAVGSGWFVVSYKAVASGWCLVLGLIACVPLVLQLSASTTAIAVASIALCACDICGL